MKMSMLKFSNFGNPCIIHSFHFQLSIKNLKKKLKSDILLHFSFFNLTQKNEKMPVFIYISILDLDQKYEMKKMNEFVFNI